jgi:hypothetical protein
MLSFSLVLGCRYGEATIDSEIPNHETYLPIAIIKFTKYPIVQSLAIGGRKLTASTFVVLLA